MIRGSPATFILARIWIIVVVVCEVRVQVARYEVRANIFAKVKILVAAGCEV